MSAIRPGFCALLSSATQHRPTWVNKEEEAARVCARMTGAELTNGAESLLSVRDACASPQQEEHADYRRPVDTSRSRRRWLSCRTSRHGSPRVGPKVEPSVVRPTRGSAGSWGTRCRGVLWVAPAMGLGGQSKTLAVPHSDSATKLSTRAETLRSSCC